MRYEGSDSDATIEQLLPGRVYHVRVRCYNGQQYSDVRTVFQSYTVQIPCLLASHHVLFSMQYSEVLSVETQAVTPCACTKPRLNGKAKSNSLHLHWDYPKYDGGSHVTQYSVLMTYPDSTTREVYTGRDLECCVAGLLPGR